MANTGTNYTSYLSYNGENTNLRIGFSWSVTDIDPDAGTAKLNYKLFGDSYNNHTTQYKSFGTGDRNYFNLNGESIFKLSTNGNGTKSNPFIMFCDDGVNNKETVWVNSGYTFSGWIQKWGVLAEGSKTIYYDEEGYASFTIYGAFQWYVGANVDNRVYIRDGTSAITIQLDKIERHSKVRSSGNKGSNWNRDKFVYVTNDYGNTWRKCNAYKTTDNGNNWTKIT